MYFRLIISIVPLISRIHKTEKQLSRCNQRVAYFPNADSRIRLRLFRFPRGKNVQCFRLLKQFLRIFHHAWDVSDYATMHFSISLCMSKTVL